MLQFAPDLPDTTPEVLVSVSGIPTARGYASPPRGVNAGASAVAANTQGGALLLKLDGSNLTLAGSAADVYSLSGGSWSSIGSGYTSGTARWAFSIFGNTILAINKATQLQSGTTTLSTVANAPKASTMETCQGFVILGDCNDTGTGLTTAFGDQPHRWWISQTFNPTGSWEPDAATQCTTGLLVDTPGAIVRHLRLNAEVVTYKAKSMYLGRFDGSDAILRFTTVSVDVGCPARDAVVGAGSSHYFPGDDNFWAFDGSRPVPIGDPIREWFYGSDVTSGQLNRSQISTIQALHDRRAGRIYWFYPPAGSTTLSKCVCYHYPTGRWGAFDLTIRDVLQAITSSITYDSFGSLYSTYADTPSISYDSQFWISATPVLSYLDTSNVLYTLTGGGAAMSLTTGWIGSEDVVSLCTKVRPKFRTKPTGGDLTGSYLTSLGSTPSSGAAIEINGEKFDPLQSGRYHRFAINFDDQTELEALKVALVPVGAE